MLTATLPRAHCLSSAVGNFSLDDWGLAAGVAAVSAPLGYLAGAQRSPAYAKVAGSMARPTMWTAVMMGATAGFLLAYQNSCGRLMGLKVRSCCPLLACCPL